MKKIFFLIERYFFSPSYFSILLSILLLPISFIYCIFMYLKYLFSLPKDYGLPVISVGNLIIGGSGKTPIIIEMAKRYKNIAVILRGYGRISKGMLLVSEFGDIKTDVKNSGDEAMLYAMELKNACVIVSEDRVKAILKAKELKCELVFLDDAYSKHNIKKLDFLIKTKEKNPFSLPSGPFKDNFYFSKDLFLLKENENFKREVNIEGSKEDLIFITAISKPERMGRFLNMPLKAKVYFPDHYFYKKEELKKLMKLHKAKTILTTKKDFVKIKDFNLAISILNLKIILDDKVFTRINSYLKGYNGRKNSKS